MRQPFLLVLLLVPAACGARSTIDGDRLAQDAAAPEGSAAPITSSTPPHVPHPPGYICFGEVRVKNVTCDVSRPAPAAGCDATMVCNGEHTLTMHCENGQCVCDNPGFDTCYCDAPKGLDDPCGVGNCCWL